ncbi:MAG: EpsG family protein [Paludibacteraceae bacterium]|nr:EpsG family protein [Paludibacteraceae bacterium]
MNILVIAALVVFLFSFTDFIPFKKERDHDICYKTAFFLTYFLFTIKYYYGADFIFYTEILDNVESPLTLLRQNSKYSDYYETGFLLLFSIFKQLNISFWLATALISTLYFYAIYQLFKYLPEKKCLALCVLVILDYNQIFATLRQTIAISLFILAIISFDKGKYVKLIVFVVVSFFFHKSALLVELLVMIILFTSYRKNITKTYFAIATVILVVFSLLPLQTIFATIADVAPISPQAKTSITHHLLQAKRIQWILLLYIPICLYLSFTDIKANTRTDRIFVSCLLAGVLITAFMYQLFYMLIRIRSYYLPLAIVSIIRQLNYDKLSNRLINGLKQVLLLCTFLFNTYSILLMYHRQNRVPSHIYDSSTVFDLLHKSKDEIIQEQSLKAMDYWSKDLNKFLHYNDEKELK